MNKKRIVIMCMGIAVAAIVALAVFRMKNTDDISTVPTSDDNVEEREDQEDTVSASIWFKKDLVYDADNRDSCKMDVAYLRNGSLKPLLICVHGGYYSSGSKSDMKQYVDEFSADGYVTASIDYPLLPNGTIVTQIESVIKAVDYFAANADIYEIDRDRIFLLGFSSGAHIAVSAAERIAERKSNQFTLAALIDISGPTDYKYMIEEYGGEDLVSSAIIDGNEEADLLKELEKVDCTDNITPSLPRTMIVHGKKDETVPYEVAERFYDSLTAAGVNAELKIISSMGHVTDTNIIIPLIKTFFER